MQKMLKVDSEGALRLPPDLLGNARPDTTYVVEKYNNKITLYPAEREPLWKTATDEEWITAFLAWVHSHKEGPGLSDEAISRDSIYD